MLEEKGGSCKGRYTDLMIRVSGRHGPTRSGVHFNKALSGLLMESAKYNAP